MKMSKLAFWLSVLFIVVSFVLAFYYYPSMPDQMASHWNAKGEVDGNMSKFWGLFLMPILSIFMFGLFLLLPSIDPLKKNFVKFRAYYDWFVVVLLGFLLYIYLLTLLWNLGYVFNMSVMMVAAMGVLFFYIGYLLKNAERNWFVGIRTPWTLSSDKVWKKTHQLGGKMFKVSGIIAFCGLFFQEIAIWLVLVPVLFTALFLFVYSYFVYKKK